MRVRGAGAGVAPLGLNRVAPISAMFVLRAGADGPAAHRHAHRRAVVTACAVGAVALGVGHAGWMLGALAMRPRPPAQTARRARPRRAVAARPRSPCSTARPSAATASTARSAAARMGAVYLGTDPKINRQVAIKTMAPEQGVPGQELTEARQRFFREAETAGRLQHPDIVTIFDAGEDQDLAFIADGVPEGRGPAAATQNLLPVADVRAHRAPEWPRRLAHARAWCTGTSSPPT